MTEPILPVPVKLPPFKAWLASNIPAVYDNTMSYYDELTSLIAWLEKEVVPNLNEAIELVKMLKDYVENYFKNLDVQEEINNKLDQMAEDGTLQEIITAYIQANVAWTFDTVADMKLATNLVAGSYAQTLGFYELDDGGGATYYIANSGTANEMNVIAVGSLYAILTNAKNVKQFGAYGDDTHDDSDAVQLACDSVKDIYVPGGVYMINPVLDNTNKLGIKLSNNSKITFAPDAEFKAIANNQTNYAVLAVYGVSNVEIIGGKITGDKTTHTGTSGEWGHCIAITNQASDVKIRNVKIADAWGDGLYINNASNVESNGLLIENCRRNGVSVISVDGYHSLNDVVEGISGTKPQCGVDIEPNNATDPIANVILENLTTKDCVGAGLNIYLLNKDGSYPTDIKVINHYDKASLNGVTIAKPASLTGLIEIIKPFYENSVEQGIALRRCYDGACKISIDTPTVLNANTSGVTTNAGGSAISIFLLSSDSHTAVGNIEIKDAYTTNATAGVISCINVTSFSDTPINKVAIINPRNNDSKYLFIDGQSPDILFTDIYGVFKLAHTSNLNLSNARYYSLYTNEGASGNVAVTIPAGINLGRRLTLQNLSDGHRYRVFMPSGQYIKQITDTAGGNFYIDKLGDKVTIKKISSTDWIVEEINCTPALS